MTAERPAPPCLPLPQPGFPLQQPRSPLRQSRLRVMKPRLPQRQTRRRQNKQRLRSHSLVCSSRKRTLRSGKPGCGGRNHGCAAANATAAEEMRPKRPLQYTAQRASQEGNVNSLHILNEDENTVQNMYFFVLDCRAEPCRVCAAGRRQHSPRRLRGGIAVSGDGFIDNLEEWRPPCPRPPPFRTQRVRLPGRERNRPEVRADDRCSAVSGNVGVLNEGEPPRLFSVWV